MQNNIMETVALKNCLRIMGYPENYDQSVMWELLNPGNDYVETYCNPFKEELNNNLLQIESTEGKESIIRNYIMQFSKEGFKINPEILYSKMDHLNEFEKYEYYCHTIFKILLNEIELACVTYKIDFDSVCEDLKLDLTFYDDSKTERFKEKRRQHDEHKYEGGNIKLSLSEIGVLCFYNNRKVTVDNDIDIAKEYGHHTKKHTINDWYNNASSNTLKPNFIERRVALHHIHRLEHILKSGHLNNDKRITVERDIEALKKAAENKK